MRPAPTSRLWRVLPAYDIGDELGQGGMGVVVSGQHRQLGRRVAIKAAARCIRGRPVRPAPFHGGTLRSRVAAGGCTAPYAVAVSLACLARR